MDAATKPPTLDVYHTGRPGASGDGQEAGCPAPGRCQNSTWPFPIMPLRNLMAHVMESREMLGMMPPLTSPQPHDSTRRACGVLLTVQQREHGDAGGNQENQL